MSSARPRRRDLPLIEAFTLMRENFTKQPNSTEVKEKKNLFIVRERSHHNPN
jgi:hypothetical protein